MASYRSMAQDKNADFISRHIGPDEPDTKAMLSALGFDDLHQMTQKIVPSNILMDRELNLAPAMDEAALLSFMRDLAARNSSVKSLIGQGYYGTLTPPVLLRNVLENPAWYTAYTPYQPEISQGRLEALLNFQTMVCDLTGLDMANASLLDEATAAAEAMAVARRVNKSKAEVFFVDETCHPQTVAVIRTRAESLGWQIKTGCPETDFIPEQAFGALFSYPASTGEITDVSDLVSGAKAAGCFCILACDLLALTILKSPGEIGADMAIGSAQRFGVPMGYGGPHAAFMATTDQHKRALPGRIIGVSVDTAGAPAYRLALQTREQHIRREKATSNICTAQALLAMMASLYAVWHGPNGLRAIAARVNRLACIFADGLRLAGYRLSSDYFFDTVHIHTEQADDLIASAVQAGFNLRRTPAGVSLSFDETCDEAVVTALWQVFGVDADFDVLDGKSHGSVPLPLNRLSDYLTHPVFHNYRSETEMMRYLRSLADKDLALDRTMIPLGSCTMKLNAAAEMMPVSWPEFADIHPFCPPDQAAGYTALIDGLCADLCEITGYDAVSMQPNSGAQGEYAGLLAIRGYLAASGQGQRDICLIASSAHGTNPASAQMAGFTVVVVACDDDGNIDLGDLKDKIAQHEDRLAAIMVTYPSTHGVFEAAIADICAMVHDAGGQVYLDGANLNAQVGLARPGKYGADVSHLNLHKTFCIPHGGGGPGMGPIGVRAHLAPFLPEHVSATGTEQAHRQVAAAPFGSPLILPISYGYIRMMGPDGLKQASQLAILSANYIAASLDRAYPILYRSAGGYVAHEVIIDIRPFKQTAGIDAEDIAKRLIDFGFHAPTMSFPVPGTLMIEPTESESKAELDRFIDAMLAIREEIRQVEDGRWPAEDNPLVNAPHTASMAVSDKWDHPYSRKTGCLPATAQAGLKYWPPVGRVDNAYGDRNLICTCPPVSSYDEVAE